MAVVEATPSTESHGVVSSGPRETIVRRASDGKPRWVFIPDFLDQALQAELVAQVQDKIDLARQTPAGEALASSCDAVGLDLQPMSQPVCENRFLNDLARKAFASALEAAGPDEALGKARDTFTALGWLYGPKASMKSHYDSPTFQGSTNEWLVSFNAGLSITFLADDEQVELRSGDLLVMDTLAVKHGVQGIEPNSAPAHCSLKDARLGILLWESFNPNLEARAQSMNQQCAALDGVSGLFPCSDSESENEGNDL